MPNTNLFTDTPLSQAIFQFFRHLEKDILQVSNRPGSVKAYLFGGCALHIHTKARGSNDIDVEFNSAKWITSKDVIISKRNVLYNNDGVRRKLELDTQFTTTLGPLHEDYQEDAIQLQKHATNSPLWIYVVTPEDLAVSKLGRYSEQDRNDILTLLKMKKMTLDSFHDRATEALKYYVGNTSVTTSQLNQVIRMYKQLESS